MSITLKQVFISAGNTETEVYAAEELQKYLEKKNVSVAEGGYPITITYDKTLSRNDGFRVSATADGMTIAGGTEHAILYGVYKFLEQYILQALSQKVWAVVYQKTGLNVP